MTGADAKTEREVRSVAVVTMKQLLEAGVHFGHQTRRWNPKMAPFIFTQRNGMIVPERYSDEGIGRVYGGDLLLKHDNGKRLYGWIAYTLLKS